MSTDDTGLSRPNTARGRLQRAVLAVLREHQADGALPTSNRFIFYELRQRGEIPLTARTVQPGKKVARRHDQDLSDASKHLRDIGLIPWPWIVDETRALFNWSYAETVAEHLMEEVDDARINPWPGSPPLILCESRTFGGVLNRTLAPEYGCPVASTNGQVGGFLHTNIAPLLRNGDEDRPVLYAGDLDNSGGQIEANTKRELEKAIGFSLNWTRVALTQAQVSQYGLIPIRKIDNRYKPPQAHDAVEVEALGQTVVTGIIRAALDALLPVPLADVRVREAAEREAAKKLLRAA